MANPNTVDKTLKPLELAPTVTPVQIVAAIITAGHVFRQGLRENEAVAVANRYVNVAKAIVDATNQ